MNLQLSENQHILATTMDGSVHSVHLWNTTTWEQIACFVLEHEVIMVYCYQNDIFCREQILMKGYEILDDIKCAYLS